METLIIPIDARAQGRPRFVNGKVIDDPKSKKFKEDLMTLVKSLRRDSTLLTGALEVVIDIYRNFTKVTNQSYGDVDNLAKSILDALNGVIWKDDRFIVDLHVRKFFTDSKPRIELNFSVKK